jgi:MIP family channel proteins
MADNDVMVPARDFHAEAFVPEETLDRWIRPLIVEFIGPFALVFIGAGAILTAATQGFGDGGTLLLVAFAHGLAIGLMIAAAGHISGGHYNPAVTIALFIGGKIGAMKGVAYIIVQLLGATAAALVLKQIYDDSIVPFSDAVPTVNYAADTDGIIVGRANAFWIEAIATFFLVYVIHGVAVDSRGAHSIAALAIGLTITMDIAMAGPLTGAAMNPARWFGPALVDGNWTDGWLYWLAPITGAVLASIAHNYVFIPRKVGFPESTPTEHHP